MQVLAEGGGLKGGAATGQGTAAILDEIPAQRMGQNIYRSKSQLSNMTKGNCGTEVRQFIIFCF